MSNQRRGNWKPAAMNDSSKIDALSLTTFCKHAKVLLEERGEEDAAFYFGQVEDWLRDGGRIQTGHNDVARILGV
jgi:hypothetical protein